MLPSRKRIAALATAAVLGVGAAVGVSGCLGDGKKVRTVTRTATGPVPTVATTPTGQGDTSGKAPICDRYPRICQFGSGG